MNQGSDEDNEVARISGIQRPEFPEPTDILDVIVPDHHLVSVQLAKAPEGTKRVEVVIENRNCHER
jgi:hypothetical protein